MYSKITLSCFYVQKPEHDRVVFLFINETVSQISGFNNGFISVMGSAVRTASLSFPMICNGYRRLPDYLGFLYGINTVNHYPH